MKKAFLTISFCYISILLFALDSEKKINSEIKEVTVFLNGASITNVGNTMLDSGVNDLVFENLSPFIDENSIEVKGEGDFTILSTSFRTNYLNDQLPGQEIKAIEDSLEVLQVKIDMQKNLRVVYENEEALLLANKNIGGGNAGVTAMELEKMANLFRTRLSDLKTRQMECKMKEKKFNIEIAKLNNQLNELNAKRDKNTGEIVVSVTAKARGNAKLTVTYNVSNAGWTPIYDIRATDSNIPIKLDFRASIFQNTGMDWKDVKLKISTGNPTQGGTQPTLNPWWISFYQPTVQPRSQGVFQRDEEKSINIQGSRSEGTDVYIDGMKMSEKKKADNTSNYTQVSESQTNILYEITIPYTIPSDNKPHSVSIQAFTVPAKYKYYGAPKLDNNVFLLAKVTGWDQYNLISGTANIFFEGTFVGKTYLNTMLTTDTFDISLGRDKNIAMTRTLLKDFSEKKMIGVNKKEIRYYEISIRNKKKQEIEIDINDQMPLSSNNEIEVELLESANAEFDKVTGKLSWNFKLAPSEEKKIKFGYSVKYPKDKVILGF